MYVDGSTKIPRTAAASAGARALPLFLLVVDLESLDEESSP